MNLLDCYVTAILGQPYNEYGKWFLNVEADSYGRVSAFTVMRDTKEELDAVTVGWHFLG